MCTLYACMDQGIHPQAPCLIPGLGEGGGKFQNVVCPQTMLSPHPVVTVSVPVRECVNCSDCECSCTSV